MNFYRRFPGDYARDTQHLSLIEHGIYNLLLDHAYATEKPIPDVETACRICRISSRRRPDCIRSGRLTVEKVLSAYFTYADAVGWTHKRVDEEIKYAESRRKKAEKGGEARWKDHAPSRLQECSKQPTDHAPRNAKSDSRFQSKRLSSSRHPQDHAASGGKPDDDYHQKFLAARERERERERESGLLDHRLLILAQENLREHPKHRNRQRKIPRRQEINAATIPSYWRHCRAAREPIFSAMYLFKPHVRQYEINRGRDRRAGNFL